MNVARGSCLLWPAKEPPFRAGARQEQARQIATSTLQGAVNKFRMWMVPNSEVMRSGAIWLIAHPLRYPLPSGMGLVRPPLDYAAENRSLEESLRVVVPVASSSAACVRSGQIDYSLRLSGGNSRLSSSAIRLSERFVWALFYFTLPNLHCSLGSSVVPWCFRS